MSLLSDRQKRSRGDEPGEPTCPVFDLTEGEYGPRDGPRRAKLPPAKRAKAGLTCRTYADVAQLVEHFTRNEGVPGSSPGVGFEKALLISAFRASTVAAALRNRLGVIQGVNMPNVRSCLSGTAWARVAMAR